MSEKGHKPTDQSAAQASPALRPSADGLAPDAAVATGPDGPPAVSEQPVTRVQRFRVTGKTDAAEVQRALLAWDQAVERAAESASPQSGREPTAGSAATLEMATHNESDPVSSEVDALRHLTSIPDPALDGVEAPGGVPEAPGRYAEVGVLGKGGMGEALQVTDRWLGRDVAMKTLRMDKRSPEHVMALRREARIIGRLTHPAIIPVYELGIREDGSPYYTMKLVADTSLAEVLRALQEGERGVTRRYPLRRLVRIFVQIAQGLQYAHESGVVHRDLKPGNILLGEHGEVQIMDWGIAKRTTGHQSQAAEGLVLGTPAYMSPEQAAGRDSEIDHRSDIYSLGVMLYEVLTLRRPHGGSGSKAQLVAARSITPLPPSMMARDREVPPELDALVMRMLSKEPEKRPQSMRAVWESLERFLAGEHERERLAEQAERSFRRGQMRLKGYRDMVTARTRLREEEAELAQQVRAWDDQSRKAQLWRLRHRLQRLEVLLSHVFSEGAELLRQAWDTVRHEGARAALIALYWQRHEDAELMGDSATRLYFARLAHELEGGAREGAKGRLQIRSSPPGAVVYAVPFHEYEDPSMDAPTAQFEIGVTPITDCELPQGPYVIVARLNGHRDAQEACYVREQNQDLLLLCDPWSRDLPLTGRSVALARLWSMTDDMEISRRTLTCLITGSPGMGKNRLIDAFRAQVKEHPTRLYALLEVHCSPLRRDLPWAVLVEMIRLRAAVLDTDSAETMRNKVYRMVLMAFSQSDRRALSEEDLAEVAAVAEVIATLPAFDLTDPARAALEGSVSLPEPARLTDALVTYFRHLSQRSPLQVLLRNVQYMDSASRAFFRQLPELAGDARLLVIATLSDAGRQPQHRGGPNRDPGPVLPYDQEIRLGALPDDALAQLVREMLGAPVGSGLRRWICRHAQGNPFLAAELVAVLQRTGGMSHQDRVWRVHPDRLPDITPGDVDGTVRALIATLPEPAREALAAAVVVGRVFWRSSLLTLGVKRVDEALEQLVERGLVTRNATSRYPSDTQYALTSTMRWRVAYDMSPPRVRRSLHRKVAAWMGARGRADLAEALVLAYHLEMGGQREDAAVLLVRAAGAAAAAQAYEEAARLYTRAHVLSDDPDLQAQTERALRSLPAAAGVAPEPLP